MNDAEGTAVVVNDEKYPIRNRTTLPELLVTLGMSHGVLVEYNGRALFPSEWAGVTLAEGDRLEILRIAAGG